MDQTYDGFEGVAKYSNDLGSCQLLQTLKAAGIVRNICSWYLVFQSRLCVSGISCHYQRSCGPSLADGRHLGVTLELEAVANS